MGWKLDLHNVQNSPYQEINSGRGNQRKMMELTYIYINKPNSHSNLMKGDDHEVKCEKGSLRS